MAEPYSVEIGPVAGPDTEAARLLRQARLDAGLSLRALALRAGTSHPTLLAYERGRKVPSVAVFLRVLRACNLAVDVLTRPRIRWRGELSRGDELAQALELAEAFPSRYERHKPALEFPRFGLSTDSQ